MSAVSPELAITLAVAVPLIGAVLIRVSRERPNQREAVSLVTAGTLFTLVASLLPGVLDGDRPTTVLWETLPGCPRNESAARSTEAARRTSRAV